MNKIWVLFGVHPKENLNAPEKKTRIQSGLMAVDSLSGLSTGLYACRKSDMRFFSVECYRQACRQLIVCGRQAARCVRSIGLSTVALFSWSTSFSSSTSHPIWLDLLWPSSLLEKKANSRQRYLVNTLTCRHRSTTHFIGRNLGFFHNSIFNF